MSANSDGLVVNVINTTGISVSVDRTQNNNVSQHNSDNSNNNAQNHNNHVVRDVHRAGIHLFTVIIEVMTLRILQNCVQLCTYVRNN
jgi:hypothetical protein